MKPILAQTNTAVTAQFDMNALTPRGAENTLNMRFTWLPLTTTCAEWDSNTPLLNVNMDGAQTR